jgi:hypothetical protein
MKTGLLLILLMIHWNYSCAQNNCRYFYFSYKYKPVLFASENELPDSIRTKILGLLKTYCPDSLLREVHFIEGRNNDNNKIKEADTSINLTWKVPCYELCYYLNIINVGQYYFNIYLDSAGQQWKTVELPSFKSDPTKLNFLTLKDVYAFARKYIKTKGCSVNINYLNGNLVLEFSKGERRKKIGGTRIVSISVHNGEKLGDRFVRNDYL